MLGGEPKTAVCVRAPQAKICAILRCYTVKNSLFPLYMRTRGNLEIFSIFALFKHFWAVSAFSAFWAFWAFWGGCARPGPPGPPGGGWSARNLGLGAEIPVSVPILTSYGCCLDYPKPLPLFWEKKSSHIPHYYTRTQYNPHSAPRYPYHTDPFENHPKIRQGCHTHVPPRPPVRPK